MAEVAFHEEYDSDSSRVKEGTKVSAYSNGHKPVRSRSRRPDEPLPARGRANTSTVTTTQARVRSDRPPAQQPPHSGVQRAPSQTRRPVQVHPPLAQGPTMSYRCSDPNCREMNCTARQYQRPPPPDVPLYATVPPPAPVFPVPQPQPTAYSRPRTSSTGGPRPTSWGPAVYNTYGYVPQTHPAEHGPPLSRSAFSRPISVYNGGPVGQPYSVQPAYTQPPDTFEFTLAHLSLDRPGSAAGRLDRTYSARHVDPAGLASPSMRSSSRSGRRLSITQDLTYSARTVPPPRRGSEYSDSYSDHGSQHSRRSEKRRSRDDMPPPVRPRPISVQTTPNFSARDVSNGVDFIQYERSDRTLVPGDRRLSRESSSRSRRPSTSTVSSSERTRATTVSSSSGGRPHIDVSRDPYWDQRRQQSQHNQTQSSTEAAEAYQRDQKEKIGLVTTPLQLAEPNQPATRSRASGQSRRSARSISGTVYSRINGVLVPIEDGSSIQTHDNGSYTYTPAGKENRTAGSAAGSVKSTGSSRMERSRGNSHTGSTAKEKTINETKAL